MDGQNRCSKIGVENSALGFGIHSLTGIVYYQIYVLSGVQIGGVV